LERKGAISVGLDADLLLVDPRKNHSVTAADLLTRHRISAYVGRTFPVSVRHVWVRGQSAWSAQAGPGSARGRLIAGPAAL
jgi:allantoinase